MSSNEIAQRDEQQAVAIQADGNTVPPMPTELAQWVESARQASLLAQSLAKTSFAGQYRNKPEEATAAILSGWELGIQPMASLKTIDVIQGQPALRAHIMRGLIQSKGHEIEVVESTDIYCKMRGRRKGAESWQHVEWDIPRVQKLGLLGKDQWKKQPKTMLIARATGEVCRLIASDVLHGMPYAAEEVDGYVHGEIAPKKAPLSITALTAPAPQAAPEQEPTAVVDVDTDDDHTAAVAELHAFGQEQGIDDIELLAHQELGAPVEHVGAQAIRELLARLHAATAAA